MAYILEHCIAVASFLLAFVLLTDVFRKNRQPGGTMAWALAIVLIPYVGVPLYLLFGGRKIKRVRKAKIELYTGESPPKAPDLSPRSLVDQALRAGGLPPPRKGNQVELIFSGETAFHRLLELIDGATDTIHVTTFILGRDEVGRAIIEALARKAAGGVRVRLLLDGLGSIWAGHRFVRPLLESGGEVARFLPVLPVRRRWSANLRNHRKMVVVDNTVAMVGGMNLSTFFMGPEPHPERFLDASAVLRGPSVQDVQEIFLYDWQYTTGSEQGLLADLPAPESTDDDRIVQVAPSGPDVPDDTMHEALVCAVVDARSRIWIVTPYFVPDESLLKALCLKARMGIDVRIFLPLRSNHRIPDWARGPALRRLHDVGAHVFVYPGGMVHTKLMLFDDTVAVSGSPNIDMRSMYVNFEIALFHYSAGEIEAIESWIANLEHTCEEWRPSPRSLVSDWTEGLCKLVSPLL